MSYRSLAVVTLVAVACSGCAGGGGVTQEPLSTHEPHHSLVLGQNGLNGDAAIVGRKDATGQPTQLYRGPGGQLHYQDGSKVQFDSVTRQLQDLRTEERISPVR
jgi:hypothetical protein